MTMLLTVVIGSLASFALGRLRVSRGSLVLDARGPDFPPGHPIPRLMASDGLADSP